MMILTRFRLWPLIGILHLLAACTTLPPPEEETEPEPPPEVSQPQTNEAAMLPLLGYYYLLQRMTPAELTRERRQLARMPSSATVQLRQAMLLGMPRATTDLARALVLLEAVQRSHAPEAASLHPLARLLSSQYNERIKLETQNDRLGQQLKQSQRKSDELQEKSDELQEKIDALTDIERSIPIRPSTVKPSP